MSKKSFWSRLFSGNTTTEGAAIEEPKADANGNVTFSAEQFATLTTHLEGWETAVEAMKAQKDAMKALTDKVASLEATSHTNSEQIAKWAAVPAAKPAATTTEPVATEEPVEIDPLDAKLKAMMR